MEKRKIIWLDGSVDARVPGKLLSDNIGFYGDCVLTGAKYRYISKLTGIGDTDLDMPEFTGRRLLDGWIYTTYRKMPAEAKGELVVEFDLNKGCSITEVDFYCMTSVDSCEISLSNDGKNFSLVEHEELNLKTPLYRNPIKENVGGRYVRLTIKGEKIELFQVWIWGDECSEEKEKDLRCFR